MSPARDAFLVQQANIYVTQVRSLHTLGIAAQTDCQHTYRYLTLEYLHQLYALNELASNTSGYYHRTVTATGNDVAEDLLTTLHSLPIEAIGKPAVRTSFSLMDSRQLVTHRDEGAICRLHSTGCGREFKFHFSCW